MRNAPRTLLLALLATACATAEPARRAEVDPDEHGRLLAKRFLVTDGHVDVPYRMTVAYEDVGEATEGGDFDVPRAVAGGLDAPFFSIYTPAHLEEEGGAKDFADGRIDYVLELVASHPEKLVLAASVEEMRAAFEAGRVAILMGMENGSPIEGDLANLEHFHGRGIRYVTLCHSRDNHICDSSYDTRHTHGGLTEFGRDVVRRMNELGIMVDVSHLSDDSFWDVMEVTRAPVIASHSSLRHFIPGFERNMSDAMVRRMAENGGVVQINFGSGFVTKAWRDAEARREEEIDRLCAESGVERDSEEGRAIAARYDAENPMPFADVTDVADHIDRVVELAGIDHVGFGSDFDGVGDSLPTGLKDVSMFPNLIAELVRRGYTDAEIEKVCSGNVLRVFSEVERVAREL